MAIIQNQFMPTDASQIDKSNKSGEDLATLGSSKTNIKTLAPSLGALAPFVSQASGILDAVYGATVEPTQREKDLNMGRAALKFFTQFGAASSVPGQTALGAANIAGASVAQDYLNKVQSDKDKADKLKQAKKAGSLSLGMQLFSADQAKDIAELKAKNVKPGAPKQYKMVNASAVVKALGLDRTNPSTGEFYKDGDVIDLLPTEFNAVPRGNLISFKNEPSVGERERKKLIEFGYNFKDLTDKEKTEYKILYQQAVEGKPVTEQIDGETVTKMRGGIDLRILKNLPVPEGYDVNKVLSKKTRDFKPNQIKSTAFGIRMFTTDGIINQLLDDGYRPNLQDMLKNHKSVLAGTGTTLQSAEARKYYAATSNFISALLREESGAAIGEGEYLRRVRELFPQIGDDANTIQLKKQLREREIQTFVKAGGDAFTVFHPDTKEFLTTVVDGKTYNKLNTKGFAKYLEEQVALTDGIIYKNKIKDKTVDELKAMLGSRDASSLLADYQLDVINELLEEKLEENNSDE